MSGNKHDQEKLRMDLLPVDALQAVSDILTRGAEKYGERNWEEGIAYNRLYGAALRHMTSFWSGEDKDPEWGTEHLAHAACSILMLLSTRLRDQEGALDNRPRQGKISLKDQQ